VEAQPQETPAPAGTEKPNGPVAAVLIAAGIGAVVLAILTVWAEASEGFAESLQYSDRVGPLSGKTIWAAVAFVVSWIVLGFGLRRRSVDLWKATILAVVLFALAYVGTFSEFFMLFAPEE
jgi:hypothetical protein